MVLSPGSRLGVYEITAQIGVGGMGEVYRATDGNLKRSVAIKVLPASVAGDAGRLARFQREAEVLAALNHPNIAAIYGLEKTRDFTALVMELVEGDDLSQRIARGAIPIDEALPIAKQIAEALEAAHEQSIIHRDLKPANIKVRDDGTVKVLDFGLAKALDSHAAPGGSPPGTNSPTATSPAMATRVGTLTGTAAYMSPEQASGKAADRRSDLWAFGVVLMEMVTGQPVFRGESVSEILASVLRDTPAWEQLPETTPQRVREVLRRCLEKDRRRRLDSAVAARLELDEALAGSDKPGMAAMPGRRRSRERLAWGIAAAATVATLGMAAWSFRSQPQASPSLAAHLMVPAPEGMAYTSVPAISPDGQRIAVTASEGGGPSKLYIRSLDRLAPRALAGTDDAINPFWSPDGRSVGFFAKGELRRVDQTTGGAQRITDAPGNSTARTGTWGPDGTILFSLTPVSIWRVSPRGEGLALVKADGRNAEFLPDGQHYLFRRDARERSQILLGTLHEDAETLLTNADSAATFAAPGFLLFNLAGVLMAQRFDLASLKTAGDPTPLAEAAAPVPFSVRVAGSASANGNLVYGWRLDPLTRLDWLDRRGALLGNASPEGSYGNVEMSPDGQEIAFDRAGATGAADVFLLDTARRVTSRFTFGPGTNNFPIWSPDGKTVAFASRSDDGMDIAKRLASSTAPQQLVVRLAAPPVMYPSDWSIDGRFLLFQRTDPKTALDIWAVPLTGTHEPFSVLTGTSNESQAQFAPDGKWLAYVSDESGRPQVFVQSFPTGGARWQVSSEGGSQPRWRRDGKELFYLAPDRQLMSVGITPGDTMRTTTPQRLFATSLPFDARRQVYSVSADGQRFLVNTTVRQDSAPFRIVLNWTSLLKQ